MFIRILTATLLALGMGRAAAAADLAAYGRLPSIEAAGLSPNGKLVAVVHPDGDKRGIIISDIDSRKVVLAIDGGPSKVRGLEWADDDHLIIFVSRTGGIAGTTARIGEYSTAQVVSVSKKKQISLVQVDNNNTGLNVVYGRPIIRTEGEHTVAYTVGVSFERGLGKPSLYRTDIEAGTTRLEYRGSGDLDSLLVGPDGQILARSFHDDHTDRSSLDVKGPNGFKPSSPPPGADPEFDIEGLSSDGNSVLVSYRIGKALNVAQAPLDGGPWQRLEEVSETDGLVFDTYTDRMMGMVTDQGAKITYRFFDQADQRFWNGIVKAFPGQRLTLADFTPDRRRVLILVDSPSSGQSYYVIDHTTGQATLVGDVYAALRPADISPVRPVQYAAADGLKIDGFLTLPRSAGAAPKNLPLVVLAHGGPAAHDDAGFDWWSQGLAAQGYAVLRANFRGSDGSGVGFEEAGYGEWGRKMQTDLSDGVRYLASQGVIDPKRVCIVGASYGGYAALAGATIDRAPYRCAVSVAGPADLSRMIPVPRKGQGETTFRYWTKFFGVSGPTDPKLEPISPVLHAAEVTVPVLLIHGKDDTVVSFNQTTLMADALKKAGKPYEMVTLESEDHWLSSSATRLKMLESVADFLKKNNPP